MTNAKREVAVLVPYRLHDGRFEVFLQKRAADAPVSPNMYGLFGGKVEKGESVEEALVREIFGELTITIENPIHFGEFKGITTIHHVFTLEVAEDFAESVVVCEGEYGKFYSFDDAQRNIPISDTNKRILREIESALVRN